MNMFDLGGMLLRVGKVRLYRRIIPCCLTGEIFFLLLFVAGHHAPQHVHPNYGASPGRFTLSVCGRSSRGHGTIAGA